MTLFSTALLAALTLSASQTSVVPEGSATVPLRDLLALQQPSQAARPLPPVLALVTRAKLEGRPGEATLTLETQFEVEVLGSDVWTRVELLELGQEGWLLETSALTGATVAISDGKLVLLSNARGRHTFTARLALRAEGKRDERRAEVTLGRDAPPVPLTLVTDGAVFAVGQAEVLPQGRTLRVSWKEVAPVSAREVVARPPLEARIPVASASWVTTLEGNLTLRAGYTLRLDREQTLTFTVPEGHTVRRATVNGAPVRVEENATQLRLSVAPSRLGEIEAQVELVLERRLGTFHLSGKLPLTLPQVSLPIDALSARAHLPSVFNYARTGGSLELEGINEEGAVSAEGLPGKELRFRQLLIGQSAPTLELAYSVDISQSYFR